MCWRDITAGSHDDDIRGWAHAIVAERYQHLMIITIGHEPNVRSRQQPKCPGDTPSDYGRMYDHVYRLMRGAGVTAPFAFVPTMSLFRVGQADAYLPPASEVQVYGADAYNRVPVGHEGYHSGADDLATMLAWGDRRLPGRPVILGEIGDVCRDPAQAKWVRGVLNAVRSARGLRRGELEPDGRVQPARRTGEERLARDGPLSRSRRRGVPRRGRPGTGGDERGRRRSSSARRRLHRREREHDDGRGGQRDVLQRSGGAARSRSTSPRPDQCPSWPDSRVPPGFRSMKPRGLLAGRGPLYPEVLAGSSSGVREPTKSWAVSRLRVSIQAA